MLRLSLFLILCLPTAVLTQTPALPSITINVGSEPGEPGSTGQGIATVSGKINLPPGWKLSIHTLTVRHAKNPGLKTTLNAFIPVKGDSSFSSKLKMNAGSYKVWAVIDVKDAEGRERQISSEQQDVNLN